MRVRDVTAEVPQTPLVQQLGGWGEVGEPDPGNYFQLFEMAITEQTAEDPKQFARALEHMGAFVDAACRRGIAYPGSINEPPLMGGIGERDPNDFRLIRPSYGFGVPWVAKPLADGRIAVVGMFSLAAKEQA